MMHNQRLLYHATAFLVVSIWGSTFVFTKLLLLAGLTPAQIFTLRFIIAYLMLLVSLFYFLLGTLLILVGMYLSDKR